MFSFFIHFWSSHSSSIQVNYYSAICRKSFNRKIYQKKIQKKNQQYIYFRFLLGFFCNFSESHLIYTYFFFTFLFSKLYLCKNKKKMQRKSNSRKGKNKEEKQVRIRGRQHSNKWIDIRNVIDISIGESIFNDYFVWSVPKMNIIPFFSLNADTNTHEPENKNKYKMRSRRSSLIHRRI